eukprot:scaffold42039_cov155-Skeletonema_dohrnii-CCMP3373.AAC.3
MAPLPKGSKRGEIPETGPLSKAKGGADEMVTTEDEACIPPHHNPSPSPPPSYRIISPGEMLPPPYW